jgi:phosphate starvation-inducible protein PhoH and related proteins|tara:strand:+ start:10350 stop:11018 length:669 start_codon:yes stop_codon:yes gene_type:complete
MTRRRSKKKENRTYSFVTLEPKSYNQNLYVSSIEKNDITFCTGPSGTGKSFICAGVSAKKLVQQEVRQIIITRPLVATGKEIGSLPGDVSEKILPYLKPMEENLKFFLKDYYSDSLNYGRIRYEPLELMRGATFHDSIMILDEAQNCTSEQIKMFITRMGENSKVIINGDVMQTDLNKKSGLNYCINRLRNIDGVGIIKFNYEDIQRNGIIGKVLEALERDA